MGFQLPKLTTVVDCAAIGYPGLEVHFWLNVTIQHYEAPPEPEPWETEYFVGLGRMIERLVVPGEYTDDGDDLHWEIPDGKAAWELWTAEGFDQQVIQWAAQEYQRSRRKRMQGELKN